MTRYRYRAHDNAGQHYEEIVEADSTFALTQSLASRGLTVSTVEPVGRPGPVFPGFYKLRWEDLQLFTEQLTAIARSGYPLVPALSAMTADLQHPTLRAATDGLRVDLERGLSLEEAFRAQEHRFPPIYGALMRAGEITGNLTGVLELMTAHARHMAGVKHRLRMAMAYPIILVAGSLAVILYQLIYIVPVFADIFGEMGGQLPAPTRVLLVLSNALRDYWPILTAAAPFAVLGLAGGFWSLRRTREGRRWLDAGLLYCPALGVAYHGVVQGRFCRTLALLLGARVPVIDALILSGAASGSAILEFGVERAADEVTQGGRIVDGLRKTRFFQPSFYWLLGTAEDRDQVEETLESLAESAERTVRAREQVLGSFITPAVTVIMSAVIGFIVVALYLPIFTLGDQIGGN